MTPLPASCFVVSHPFSAAAEVGAELDEVNGITEEAANPGFNYQMF